MGDGTGVVASHPENELIAEERWSEPDEFAVDTAGDAGRQGGTVGEDVER